MRPLHSVGRTKAEARHGTPEQCCVSPERRQSLVQHRSLSFVPISLWPLQNAAAPRGQRGDHQGEKRRTPGLRRNGHFFKELREFPESYMTDTPRRSGERMCAAAVSGGLLGVRRMACRAHQTGRGGGREGGGRGGREWVHKQLCGQRGGCGDDNMHGRQEGAGDLWWHGWASGSDGETGCKGWES